MADNVRVGPAGWSYEDWAGIVYPRPMSATLHALEYLAQFFDTVEVNVSFYRPLPKTYGPSWMRKVAGNPRFKFTAKVWQRFTHDRDIFPSAAEVAECREGYVALQEACKLGALLVQFPWSFRRTTENRDWLARVLDAFSAFPLAVEVRHASWDVPEFYTALTERGITFCTIDQPLFEDSIGATDRLTSRIGYVRLHGQNHDAWFRDDAGRDERYDYLYSEQELRPWIDKVERIRQSAEEVYVITNNHYEGQAVVNAFDLQAGLGKTDLVLPARLVEHYPQLSRLLKSGGCVDGSRQMDLLNP